MSEKRCKSIWSGWSTETIRCERWNGHVGKHAAFIGLDGSPLTWNDEFPCKNCGKLIDRPPEDHFNRWRHVETDKHECGLLAEPTEKAESTKGS